jgi:polysaccharide chain length determinant protein (PEP-CTERM system associated)
MVDDLQEKQSEPIDVQHYVALARRRHLHFLIPLLLGWLTVWGVSWILPPRYRSGTLILVEQPTMPRDYVTPNVSDDLQERLQSITQQILSRTRLLHIIDEKNLDAGNRAQITPDEKVERMRKDIDIELVRDPQGRVDAFNVYYIARDPRIAQQVTTELTDLFINENLEVRQHQSEDTTKFLEGQLETARQALAAQEERIREFKSQHVGEMPAQLESNLQILGGVQSQLRTEEDALNSARQQRIYLQSLVDQYRTLQVSTSNGEGVPVGLPAIDQELDRLKSQLADLSSHYTDRHPDVRKLKDQIAKTQHMREQFLAEGSAGGGTRVGGGGAQPSGLAQLQSQLQSNQAEIANREHSIEQLKAKVNEYQGRLNQEPVREQELADLTLGYDQSKANYDDLLKKKNESAMATSMELLQQGERFRIVDPPSLPVKPDFPNRLKFCLIGLGVGLALGAFVAGAAEMADDRLYSESEIKKLLPVPIICEIPVISTPLDHHERSDKDWPRWTAAALVITTILAGSVFSYLRG